MNIFAPIGRAFLSLLAQIGRLTIFLWAAVTNCFRPPIYWFHILQQVIRIGYFSQHQTEELAAESHPVTR